MTLVQFMALQKGDHIVWRGELREVSHLQLNEDLGVFRIIFADRVLPVSTPWRDDFEALVMADP